MSVGMFQFWAELDNPVRENEIAQHLMNKIRESEPTADAKRVRTNPEAADLGPVVEVLVMAASHLTVMGIIDGIRFVWERYKAPVTVRLPDGTTLVASGVTKEFAARLSKLTGVNIDEPRS